MADPTQAADLAVRAHDIVVCMERARPSEFEALSILGSAVRLALHLRGAPVVDNELLRQVAIHVLLLQPGEVRPALELLAEAEFVQLVTEGKTIKAIIPNVPYFDDLFGTLGEVAQSGGLNEMEQLTVLIAQRLSQSPISREHVFSLGAEKRAVDKALRIGDECCRA